MSTADLEPFSDYEWSTSRERLLLPASHANESCVRVRYRRRGTRLYRSFLLLGDFAGEPPREAIARAISEHEANG